MSLCEGIRGWRVVQLTSCAPAKVISSLEVPTRVQMCKHALLNDADTHDMPNNDEYAMLATEKEAS